MTKNHYVYKLQHIDTGEFYFGSRTCECNPSEDKYMGSMSVWNPDKDKLTKTILKSNFKTRNVALEYEASLIEENWNNKLIRNYHIPNSKQYRKSIHPFINNKKMIEWCKRHKVEVTTPDGSDIDWDSNAINRVIVHGLPYMTDTEYRKRRKINVKIQAPEPILIYPSQR